MVLFCGKTTDYWLGLQEAVEKNADNIPAYEKLVEENAILRAIIRRYELAARDVEILKNRLPCA